MRYRLRITRSTAKALAEVLPQKVATTADEFCRKCNKSAAHAHHATRKAAT